MALNLAAIRVIVYDLDGTVYDDTRHFDLYARDIQSRLPEAARDAFWLDYTGVAGRRHPALRIGTFYDTLHDLVLEVRGGQVQRALRWTGDEVPPAERARLYPDPVAPDHARIMNVGDLWWVPTAVSAHHGGLPAQHWEAFLQIRTVMSAPAFEMRAIPDLADTVRALRGRVVQVLVTNSPQPDSEAILAKVGLTGLLDRLCFQSNKPAGLQAVLQTLTADYRIALSGILSIGDNLTNEIAPARAMGCQTVLIDPHGAGIPGDADLIVRTMTDFLPILRQLAAERSAE